MGPVGHFWDVLFDRRTLGRCFAPARNKTGATVPQRRENVAVGLAYSTKIIDNSAVRHPCYIIQYNAALYTEALHSSIISTGIIIIISTSTSPMCESGAHQQAGEPHTRRKAIYCTQRDGCIRGAFT
jgi:hypothetical protein